MKSVSHKFSQSPLKKYADIEIDPYSTVIVEDLLQGQSEWRNLPDIVRLTCKALTDVVRSQGETIREIEKQLPTRASKAELHTGLSLKANISDVSRTIAEVASSLDSKISFDDLQTVLKDHVMKSDLQYMLSNKVSIDELRQMIDRTNMMGSSELKTEVEILKTRMEEFQREVVKKIGGQPSLKDLSQITQALEMKANLQEVNEALETKASKQSVQSALQKKVNKQDLEERLQAYASLQDVQPLVDSLEQKASLDQIEKVAQILEVKVDRADFTILINSVQGKAEQGDLESQRDIINDIKMLSEQRYQDSINKLDQNRGEIEELRNQLINVLSKKADLKEFEKLQNIANRKLGENENSSNSFNQFRTDTYNDLSRLRDEILQQKQFMSEQLQTTIQKSSHLSQKLSDELYNLSEQVRTVDDERRADSEDIRKIISRLTNIKKEQTSKLQYVYEEIDVIKKFIDEIPQRYALRKEMGDLKARLTAHQEEFKNNELQKIQQGDFNIRLSTIRDEMRSELKACWNEMQTLIAKKPNIIEVQSWLNGKSDSSINDIVRAKVSQQDFDELKKIVHKVCVDQDERVTQRDFLQHIQFTKNVLDLIQKDMLLKANIKDVCTLIDSKANIEDVNIALTQIHKELENRCQYEDLNQVVKKQSTLNDQLCEENIVARFQWRSGQLKSGSTIPWEYQVINTLPDNFIWEKDKSSILTVAPGVYQIIYGFYSKRKPNIQILVNGESVITSYQNQTQVVPSSSKLKEQLKHSQGNITGTTSIDFIVLPARARISVAYDCDTQGEGFIGLKRL